MSDLQSSSARLPAAGDRPTTTDAETIAKMAAMIDKGATLVISPDLREWCEANGIEIDGERVRVSYYVPPRTLATVGTPLPFPDYPCFCAPPAPAAVSAVRSSDGRET